MNSFTRYVDKLFIFAVIAFLILLFSIQRSIKMTTPWRPFEMVKMKAKTIDSKNNRNPNIQLNPRRHVRERTLKIIPLFPQNFKLIQKQRFSNKKKLYLVKSFLWLLDFRIDLSEESIPIIRKKKFAYKNDTLVKIQIK